MRYRSFALLAAGLLLASAPAFAATVSGTVSDTMCGKDHSAMGMGNAADCTRACVKAGASYALVTSSKVYVLKGDKAQLDKLAGAKVVVNGDVAGTSITVKSIKAAQ